jgi:hypothetical protein
MDTKMTEVHEEILNSAFREHESLPLQIQRLIQKRSFKIQFECLTACDYSKSQLRTSV